MANINLSMRQYSLLETFLRRTSFNIPTAQHFDQRPFRSLLIRGWVAYSRHHGGFHLTREGRAAWEQFRHADIQRRDPTKPLTAFFDPTAYGLSDHRLHVVKSSAA